MADDNQDFLDLLRQVDKQNNQSQRELAKKLGFSLGLDVHAGHGLTYESAKILSKIKYINEFNIGHFLIGESIFYSLKTVIKCQCIQQI